MQRRIVTTGAVLALLLDVGASAAPSGGALGTAALKPAVDDPGRPAGATRLDETRKPAQVLAFLGLRRGMAVADIITGQAYWA